MNYSDKKVRTLETTNAYIKEFSTMQSLRDLMNHRLLGESMFEF